MIEGLIFLTLLAVVAVRGWLWVRAWRLPRTVWLDNFNARR